MGNIFSNDKCYFKTKTETKKVRFLDNKELLDNKQLLDKIKILEDKIEKYENPIQTIDDKKIKDIVKNLLLNKNINIGLLPDKIESKLYENIIKIILSILQETLNNTKVELLGHEIKMNLKQSI